MKKSPLEAYFLMWLTGGLYEFHWGARLMGAINAKLYRPVFNLDHIRNILVFSFVAIFFSPVLLFFAVVSEVTVWIFIPVVTISIMTFTGTQILVLYRIAAGIREIETAQGITQQVNPLLAVVSIFVYYLAIPYLQDHVNKLEWRSHTTV
ncbi:hypothetical protein ACFLWV_02945 [Chloroflexota bacterium]